MRQVIKYHLLCINSSEYETAILHCLMIAWLDDSPSNLYHQYVMEADRLGVSYCNKVNFAD